MYEHIFIFLKSSFVGVLCSLFSSFWAVSITTMPDVIVGEIKLKTDYFVFGSWALAYLSMGRVMALVEQALRWLSLPNDIEVRVVQGKDMHLGPPGPRRDPLSGYRYGNMADRGWFLVLLLLSFFSVGSPKNQILHFLILLGWQI